MTIEKLNEAMIAAMKSGEKRRKIVISGLIDAVKKAAMTPKGKIEITEALVDETLIKCLKSFQEAYDTCPKSRVEYLEMYEYELNIVKEFAPSLITDPEEIKSMIVDAVNGEIEFTKANKGKIMKIISPIFKGKADMKIVNNVVSTLLA